MSMEIKQKTILIVDDEETFRDILVTALSSKKYITMEGYNGREGVDLALSRHPDLIMMDLQMPEMDGMEAFKKIREDVAWGANVPVIILTNQNPTDPSLIEGVANLKPFHYLIKSNWRLADVVQKIEEILNEQDKK